MNLKKILVVEDNLDTLRFLKVMLSKDFEVLTAENGVQALELARTESPSLILMDVVMPILNGYDTCKLLKEDQRTSGIPILFLSSKNSADDISFAFTVGADDFITKPFDYKELLARVKNRVTKQEVEANRVLQVGSLRIDLSNREVSYASEEVHLTLTEYDILLALVTRRGTVVSREEIMKYVWRDSANATSDRTIDVHIRALRKKIPSLNKYISSVYGVGYKYDL